MTNIKICGIVSHFNRKEVSQLTHISFSVYLQCIIKEESIKKCLLNVVPLQKETSSLTCGYTHNLTLIGYIPTLKSLLHCITYLIKKLN